MEKVVNIKEQVGNRNRDENAKNKGKIRNQNYCNKWRMSLMGSSADETWLREKN